MYTSTLETTEPATVDKNMPLIASLSKNLAERSVAKVLKQYHHLESKALQALKSRLPKTALVNAEDSQQEVLLLRRVNEDISKRIEATIAVYLPKIEAQLRKTLQNEALEHIQQLHLQQTRQLD